MHNKTPLERLQQRNIDKGIITPEKMRDEWGLWRQVAKYKWIDEIDWDFDVTPRPGGIIKARQMGRQQDVAVGGVELEYDITQNRWKVKGTNESFYDDIDLVNKKPASSTDEFVDKWLEKESKIQENS